jgi:hypothetical protein
MNGAALIRYDAAKVALAAAHHVHEIKSTRDKTAAVRRAGGELRDTAPSFQDVTFRSRSGERRPRRYLHRPRSIVGITLTENVSGATGHHAHRADHFVRQHQRHHHRGIDNHGLYAPPQPWGSGTFAPPPLP